ncbi:MAG TPA: amidohydrolase [Thermodesulfobacteriota bacterium]|nr:amidohydrolase [Thermodesulfobacteriota bacterium]
MLEPILLLGIPLVAMSLLPSSSFGEEPKNPLWAKIDQLSEAVEGKAISWRRDIHQNPELGNREFRTSKLVADHLKSLGLEVKTGIAHTGVVGILRGKRSAPVVALRADIDALPLTEAVDLPFASKVKTTWEGKEVGVMHACGHDVHTAILMATAEVLSKIKDELPGTVKFIFQPAEEGAPAGEQGGAFLMVKEGVLDSPKVDAIFGLHVQTAPLGALFYRSGGFMASSDNMKITIHGSASHAARPWDGVDPIVIASQAVLALQTIVSRQTDLTATPAVVTIGTIEGGVRRNIIADKVEMAGTIRCLDPRIRKEIHEKVRKTVTMIAESAGGKAEVNIQLGPPVVHNDPALTQKAVPTLDRVAGKGKLLPALQRTGAEDFAYYQEKVPGFFFNLGITPEGKKGAPGHSPYFIVDEKGIVVGIRAMSNLALDYLSQQP